MIRYARPIPTPNRLATNVILSWKVFAQAVASRGGKARKLSQANPVTDDGRKVDSL